MAFETHIDVRLEEGQRQVVLLAIARLAVERPGWDMMLGEIAGLLHGPEMFEQFKALKRAEGRLPGPDGSTLPGPGRETSDDH